VVRGSQFAGLDYEGCITGKLIENGGKVDGAAAAGIMVIVRSAVVVKVDMAALPGGKERVKVPVQPGMPAVEDKTQAA